MNGKPGTPIPPLRVVGVIAHCREVSRFRGGDPVSLARARLKSETRRLANLQRLVYHVLPRRSGTEPTAKMSGVDAGN